MQWIERIRMKLRIRRFRRDFEWLGYDLSGFSDDEVIRRIKLWHQGVARAANEAAITTKQMGNALKQMASACARAEN